MVAHQYPPNRLTAVRLPHNQLTQQKRITPLKDCIAMRHSQLLFRFQQQSQVTSTCMLSLQ